MLTPPSKHVRRQMQAQKTSGTGIEMAVRSALHRRGYRFRVDRRQLPEQRFRGDIVWSGRRIAVFLDGCFWHGCPKHGTTPKSNAAWWGAKIEANRDRDLRVDSELLQRGWRVLRFWEHEEADDIVARIIDALTEPSHR